MVSGGFDLNMLVLDFPRSDRCSDADWWPTVNAFEAALKTNKAQRRDRRLDAARTCRRSHAAELLRRGIVPLHGIAEAIDAAEAAAFIGEAWATARLRPLVGQVSAAGGGDDGRATLLDERPNCRAPLDEAEAKALLAEAGLAGARRASAPAMPAKPSPRPTALGFPVALKALGIAHKSEHGAVRLNLRDDGRRCAPRPTLWPGSAPASMSSAW